MEHFPKGCLRGAFGDVIRLIAQRADLRQRLVDHALQRVGCAARIELRGQGGNLRFEALKSRRRHRGAVEPLLHGAQHQLDIDRRRLRPDLAQAVLDTLKALVDVLRSGAQMLRDCAYFLRKPIDDAREALGFLRPGLAYGYAFGEAGNLLSEAMQRAGHVAVLAGGPGLFQLRSDIVKVALEVGEIGAADLAQPHFGHLPPQDRDRLRQAFDPLRLRGFGDGLPDAVEFGLEAGDGGAVDAVRGKKLDRAGETVDLRPDPRRPLHKILGHPEDSAVEFGKRGGKCLDLRAAALRELGRDATHQSLERSDLHPGLPNRALEPVHVGVDAVDDGGPIGVPTLLDPVDQACHLIAKRCKRLGERRIFRQRGIGAAGRR